MADRVLVAAANNVRWRDLVCRAHGVPTSFQPGHWVARRRAPALCPDAVTLRPDAAAEHVLHLADDGPGCAVKDSFATLDPRADGLRAALRGELDRVAGSGCERPFGMLGVSNVFTTTMPADAAWVGIAAALAAGSWALPLVGYSRGEPLQAAIASGSAEIGTFVVWLRPSDAASS